MKLVINKGLRCLRKENTFNSKIMKEKKSHHMPEGNGTKSKWVLCYQISEKCCLQLRLQIMCADDKFSNPFKSYLDKNAV